MATREASVMAAKEIFTIFNLVQISAMEMILGPDI